MKLCSILLYIFALITMWVASSRSFVQSICNVFPTFYDVCGFFHWHYILLPTKANHILTYVSVCTWKNITPSLTCMDAHHQCSSGIWVTSCLKWFLTSWQYFVIIERFALLVCCLTELEIWPIVLLVLWPDFKILCTIIVLYFDLVRSASTRPCPGAYDEQGG
jgi:hypothetical protein